MGLSMSSLAYREGGDGLRFGGAAFSYGAYFFGGLEFHGDSIEFNAEGFGQSLADRFAIVVELRTLQDHSGIHIHEGEAFLSGEGERMPQENQRVTTFPARIGVGEMHSDV